MTRTFSLLCVLLLASWAISGCKTMQHVEQSRMAFTAAPFEVTPPQVTALPDGDVPGDIRMVTAALVQKLRQDPKGIPRVGFDASGTHSTPETTFTYLGFSVAGIAVTEHWARETGRKSFACRAAGVMLFADQLGRRAMVDYVADYELFPDRIVILNSAVNPVPPVFPNTQAFIINAQEFKNIVDQRPDFPAFYAGVVTKAQSMTPTPEERRARQEAQSMSFFERLKKTSAGEREDNIMVIFVMDRLTPDADLEVVVTKTLHDRQSMAKPVYRDFQGWRVAVFGGNFAVDRDVFYAKVYYKPAPGVLPEGQTQALIGLFTSEKGYDVQPAAAASTARPTVQPAAFAPAEGPLGSATRVLDTSNRDDARIIQARLAEMGFYSMVVDGLWGQGSRGALQSFQRAHGLAADGQWNVQTQRKLFSGSGR